MPIKHMGKDKKYFGVKIQLVGIAIIIVGVFLALFTIGGGIFTGLWNPFLSEGILLILIGMLVVIYGALRKD